MQIAIAAGAVFLVLTIWYLFRLLHCLRHGRLLRAGGSCLGCAVTGTATAALAILVASYYSYARLVEEQIVSRIEFSRTGTDAYEARLMIPGSIDQFFPLRGDEWQIDARIITWQPPMTVLGLDPIFRLDRLSGRFGDIERERSETRTVHELSPELPADLWQLARQFPKLTPGVDAHYGTATFVPMADGARYEVSLSRDALIARPANDAAREAVGRWHGNE